MSRTTCRTYIMCETETCIPMTVCIILCVHVQCHGIKIDGKLAERVMEVHNSLLQG